MYDLKKEKPSFTGCHLATDQTPVYHYIHTTSTHQCKTTLYVTTMSPLELASDDENDIYSSDEALCEILGLTSLDDIAMDETDKDPREKESSQAVSYTHLTLPTTILV